METSLLTSWTAAPIAAKSTLDLALIEQVGRTTLSWELAHLTITA